MNKHLKNPALIVCGHNAFARIQNMAVEVKHGMGFMDLPIVVNEWLCSPEEIQILDEAHPVVQSLRGNLFCDSQMYRLSSVDA
jgi:hypothetical protein